MYGKNKRAFVFQARATTAQLCPGRDTFEFDQGHVTKNQPITVLVLLSELSMYLTNAVIHISVWTLPFLVFSSSSQQSPEYPALHIHAPFIKLPPFKQLI